MRILSIGKSIVSKAKNINVIDCRNIQQNGNGLPVIKIAGFSKNAENVATPLALEKAIPDMQDFLKKFRHVIKGFNGGEQEFKTIPSKTNIDLRPVISGFMGKRNMYEITKKGFFPRVVVGGFNGERAVKPQVPNIFSKSTGKNILELDKNYEVADLVLRRPVISGFTQNAANTAKYVDMPVVKDKPTRVVVKGFGG